MRSATLFVALICLSLFAAAQEVPEPVMVPEAWVDLGEATAEPEQGTAGEYGTWTITYTVGAGGIAAGGGIRVQLPDEWHAGARNSALRLQTKDPKADNYVTASVSNDGATVRCIVEDERDNELIKHAKKSLDGRSERYVFVVRVLVTGGALAEGDTIRVVYGDTSGGSKGYLAGAVSVLPMPVLVALDHDGDSRFENVSRTPYIETRSGQAVYAQIHQPSTAAAGAPITCRVAMLDKEFNPAMGPATFKLRYPEGMTGPESVSIYRDHAWAEFEVTPERQGVVRIAGVWEAEGRELLGNPTEVLVSLPERQLYWGDLHSHTSYSWDGVGRDAFNYARYTTSLDFYAMTDHSQEPEPGWNRGLNTFYWPEYVSLTEAYCAPGSFVTLHAYECSFGPPYGHHNVYFRGGPGALINPQTSTLPALWDALEAGNALTIPHHTGKFPKGVEFDLVNDELRRNFEMYSGHGLSEVYDPSHPLAFEQSDFTSDSSSAEGAVNLQDVWRLGLKLSTIGSSDDHRAQPGNAMYGLAALRATGLTRNDIFQALYDKHTYATTGAKIILYFDVNGTPMGQTAPPSDVARVQVRAHGTDVIEWVEVLRLLPGEEKFSVVQRWEPKALDFEANWEDPDGKVGAIYYARLRQQKLVYKRVAQAWSSAVWIGAGGDGNGRVARLAD